MGSALGQYYGQQAARTRQDSPRVYELVSFRVRPEQENQFSPVPPPRDFFGHQIGDDSLRGDHEEEGRISACGWCGGRP